MLANQEGDWFEPVEGKKPWGVQEVDPSRRFAVLEVSGDDEDRHVAVWNLTSGELVWAPERAHAIRWNRDASEVYVVGARDVYDHGYLGRYSWPGLLPRGGGSIPIQGYMFVCAGVSPNGALIGVADIDQGETYVALYRNPDTEGPQQPVDVWEHHGSNLINGLEFAPDGTALVWTLGGHHYWWTEKDEFGPSEGGEFEVGHVCVWRTADTNPRVVKMIRIVARLAPGWSADDPDDMLCSQMFQGPLFLDNQRFRVLPPTGEWKTYTINGDEVADPDAGTKVDIKKLTTVSLRPTKH